MGAIFPIQTHLHQCWGPQKPSFHHKHNTFQILYLAEAPHSENLFGHVWANHSEQTAGNGHSPKYLCEQWGKSIPQIYWSFGFGNYPKYDSAKLAILRTQTYIGSNPAVGGVKGSVFYVICPDYGFGRIAVTLDANAWCAFKSSGRILSGGQYWYSIPIQSMYGIFTYIYHKDQPNVGKYTIHGSYGIDLSVFIPFCSCLFHPPPNTIHDIRGMSGHTIQTPNLMGYDWTRVLYLIWWDFDEHIICPFPNCGSSLQPPITNFSS